MSEQILARLREQPHEPLCLRCYVGRESDPCSCWLGRATEFIEAALSESATLMEGIRRLIEEWRAKADRLCPIIDIRSLPADGWSQQQFQDRLVGAVIADMASQFAALLAAHERNQ